MRGEDLGFRVRGVGSAPELLREQLGERSEVSIVDALEDVVEVLPHRYWEMTDDEAIGHDKNRGRLTRTMEMKKSETRVSEGWEELHMCKELKRGRGRGKGREVERTWFGASKGEERVANS